MKQTIPTSSYSYNTSTRQVSWGSNIILNQDQVLLIVNVTRGKILYNLTDDSTSFKTFTSTIVGNQATLNDLVDISGHANTDKLAIFYDDRAASISLPATIALPTGASTEATLSSANTTITSINNKLPATIGRVASSTRNSSTFASQSSGTVLASNAGRFGFTIVNYEANDLYLRFASAAADPVTNWNIKLRTNEKYEQLGPMVYTGEIRGIYASSGTTPTATNGCRAIEWVA